MPDLAQFDDIKICSYVGSRIRAERLRLRLSQAEFAKKSGVALRTYVRFETSGKGTILTLVAILRALNRLRGLELLVPVEAIAARGGGDVVARMERLSGRRRAKRAGAD